MYISPVLIRNGSEMWKKHLSPFQTHQINEKEIAQTKGKKKKYLKKSVSWICEYERIFDYFLKRTGLRKFSGVAHSAHTKREK